jgi:signal recognition particle receptor subunit beta
MGHEMNSISCFEEDELRDVVILVYANKQDLPNAIKPQELGNRLRLNSITNRVGKFREHAQQTGDGLYEGLDWLGGGKSLTHLRL